MLLDPRRLTAEVVGSALLAAVVIDSGIAAQRMSPDDVGLQLLENALATAGGLYVIVTVLDGVHLNPAVTMADAMFGGTRWRQLPVLAAAQVAGCVLGAVVANLMFGAAPVTISESDRLTGGHFLSESVATAVLLVVVFGLVRGSRSDRIASSVACYIGAAYFFTSSTSFANPAITVARMFSDTFAGIAPSSAPAFVAAQLVGVVVAVPLIRVLFTDTRPEST